MAKAENWRSVPGYPDIEINDQLVVRSKSRTTEYDHSLWGRQTRCFPSKVLTTQKQHKDGYLTVFVNSVRRPVGLHVIVCTAFHGASPAGKPYALHRDGLGARRDCSRRRPRQGEADRRRRACDPVRNGPDPCARPEVRCLCNNHPPGAHRRNLGSHLKELPRGTHCDDRR